MADFFIMHMQRSGGTFLAHMLNLHSDICCWEEIFKGGGGVNAKKCKDFKKALENRQKKFFGCRIPYGHIDDEIIKFIHDNNLIGIHLIRRNVLRQAMFQKHTFTYTNTIPDKIIFNIFKLEKNIECILNYVTTYKHLANFTLFYEDFTNGGQHVSEFSNEPLRKSLLSYLGVTDEPLTSSYTRFQEDNLSALLARPIKNNFFDDLPEICDNYQELVKSGLFKYAQWKFPEL